MTLDVHAVGWLVDYLILMMYLAEIYFGLMSKAEPEPLDPVSPECEVTEPEKPTEAEDELDPVFETNPSELFRAPDV